MKAVILAAGIGSRLRPITYKKPKCMVKVSGRPILDYQIKAFAAAGIKDIAIVVGYQSKMVKEYCRYINDINISIIENDDFESTNNMFSLYLASYFWKDEEFILSNGDVIFDERIPLYLNECSFPDLIAADKGSYSEESMKIIVNENNLIVDISKNISASEAYGNSIDLYKFSVSSSGILFNHIKEIIEYEKRLREWTEVAIQDLVKCQKIMMQPYDINGLNWIEIDNFDDLSVADKMYSTIKTSISDAKIFFIDLDGTIYLGNKPITGSANFINMLLKNEKLYYFLSNNSSKDKNNYVKILSSMGITAKENQIILSTDGLIEYLKCSNINDVFVVGTSAMEKSIVEAGINTKSEKPMLVVLGYDTELTYEKIKRAALLINKGIDYIATHCDIVCPTDEGPIPDIGSLIALIEIATGKKPRKIFGKPNVEMIGHVLKKHGIIASQAVVIGDRIYTDMQLAKNIGANFILVLSGETKREDIEELDEYPDLITNSLNDLLQE